MEDGLQTQFDFELPSGYVDPETGSLHRVGSMRLATAADEILPMKDPRVLSNPAYLSVILLSRVVTRLGNLKMINPGVIEGLFASDFAFLQSLYNRINQTGKATKDVSCPECKRTFPVEVYAPGES